MFAASVLELFQIIILRNRAYIIYCLYYILLYYKYDLYLKYVIRILFIVKNIELMY